MERVGVVMKLTLVNHTSFVFVDVFDRVFDGEDVAREVVVNVVNH